MSFWSWLTGNTEGITPNANGDHYQPGDADGVEFDGEETYSRSLPFPITSPWDGWPAEWNTPAWQAPQNGFSKLIDTAWACLDLNSSVLSAMPVYRMQSGQIVDPMTWMSNPDPMIYASWQEFAKQLFWDYQMGEAFVLPMATASNGFPLNFRVVPPWLVNVELVGGTRRYAVGSMDVTNEILHIRYQSNTADAHGHGPLEVGGARIVAAGLLQRYANRLAETGGTPHYWLGVDRRLNKAEADDLLDQWVESRTRHAGHPALLSGGASLNQLQAMNAKDMALLELAQFNESRIAILLGVPPFLVGLPSGGDSMTYSNVSSLFDFHDRSSLRPKAMSVMTAMSGWALPRGQTLELNRDEYSRPGLLERAQSYALLITAGVMRPEEARTMERLHGPAPEQPPTPDTTTTLDSPAPHALSLSGGDNG